MYDVDRFNILSRNRSASSHTKKRNPCRNGAIGSLSRLSLRERTRVQAVMTFGLSPLQNTDRIADHLVQANGFARALEFSLQIPH